MRPTQVEISRALVAKGRGRAADRYIVEMVDQTDTLLTAIGNLGHRIAELERAAETTRVEHAAALGLATARIRELEGERDELLGLVKNDALWGSGCFAPFGGLVVDDATCTNDPPCWEHRRRAIVARIEKATKGTR